MKREIVVERVVQKHNNRRGARRAHGVDLEGTTQEEGAG